MLQHKMTVKDLSLEVEKIKQNNNAKTGYRKFTYIQAKRIRSLIKKTLNDVKIIQNKTKVIGNRMVEVEKKNDTKEP